MPEDAATVLPFPRPTLPAADDEKRDIARCTRAVTAEFSAAIVDQAALRVAADNRHAYSRQAVVNLLQATANDIRRHKDGIAIEPGGAA